METYTKWKSERGARPRQATDACGACIPGRANRGWHGLRREEGISTRDIPNTYIWFVLLRIGAINNVHI